MTCFLSKTCFRTHNHDRRSKAHQKSRKADCKIAVVGGSMVRFFLNAFPLRLLYRKPIKNYLPDFFLLRGDGDRLPPNSAKEKLRKKMYFWSKELYFQPFSYHYSVAKIFGAFPLRGEGGSPQFR